MSYDVDAQVSAAIAAARDRAARETLQRMIANPRWVRARLDLLDAYERLCAGRRAPSMAILVTDLRYVEEALVSAEFVARLARKQRRKLSLEPAQAAVIRRLVAEEVAA